MLSPVLFFLATALALSIGWGIRGNFGHEYGAMIPGALAAMTAALLSGREDWIRRAPLIGFFGALGWSFGGSISYMQVIAYTHSGHSSSTLYGFACLFVIGFLWAAPGGAGAAMAASFQRERLDRLFPAIIAVFVAWTLQDVVFAMLPYDDSDFRHENPLYWYDTDWVSVLVALGAVGILAAIRRCWDEGCSLVLYMALGWWVGFLLLVNVLGLRMTPPRGDSWAGILGMVGGLLCYLSRRGDRAVVWAALTTGIWGGIGFASATLFKLLEIKSGWDANWHSVLEQSYGFINGIGVAAAMWRLRAATPTLVETNASRWTNRFAALFILIGITYVNLAKNPPEWIKSKTLPEEMYGIPSAVWFAMAYLLLLAVALAILKTNPPLLPLNPLGRSQLLLLAFLWWIVAGNFERAIVHFAPQRLVTEGVIFFNAAILSLLLLRRVDAPTFATTALDLKIGRVIAFGAAAFVLVSAGSWGMVRAVYGDTFAGYANKHVRFGTNAPASGPVKGRAHP